jgi:hypothetical protein
MKCGGFHNDATHSGELKDMTPPENTSIIGEIKKIRSISH